MFLLFGSQIFLAQVCFAISLVFMIASLVLDGLLGVGTVADADLTRSALNHAIRLEALYPRSTLPELQSHRSVKSWSGESRQSAIHDAYLNGTLPPGENATNATILPLGYTRHAKEIAERRIALARYRLADQIRPTIR